MPRRWSILVAMWASAVAGAAGAGEIASPHAEHADAGAGGAPVPPSWARAWIGAPAEFRSERAFNDPWVCEQSFVVVDADAVFGAPGRGGLGVAPGLVLPLGGDRDVAVRHVERQLGVDPAPCWYGEIEGEPGGYALFVQVDGEVAAKFQSPRLGVWELVHAGPGVSALRRIQEFALPSCGNTAGQQEVANAAPAGEDDQAPPATPPQRGLYYFADVLFPYTTAAKTFAGGASAIEAQINLAIADANLAYENSDIFARIRSAGAIEVNYQESGDYSLDLARLAGTSDGFMDNIHLVRAQVAADLVAMINSVSAGGACGIGYVMTAESAQFSALAFSVTGLNCLSQLTLPHELGHNMGCAHDRDNAQGPGCFSYSYGYRAPGSAFRTIMAYPPGPRIQYFSNPDVDFNNQPTGIAIGLATEAANAQTVNQTIDTVSNWRTFYTSAPGTFNLTGPPNASTTADRRPTFTWQPANQTDYYRLQIDNDPAFLSLEVDQSLIQATSFQLTTNVLQPGVTYFWRVRAYNPIGSSLGTPQLWSFTVPLNLPGAFTLSSPGPGEAGVAVTPLFEWTVSIDADTYTLTVDNNPDFASPVAAVSGISATNYALLTPQLSPTTTYYWRVRAVNVVGQTSATPSSSTFTTAQLPPGSFALQAPGDGASLATLTPTLQWSASANAASYELVIDDQPTLNTPIYNATGIMGTSKIVPPGVLFNNGYFFWRVKAVNSAGTTVGSPPTYGFGVSLSPCSGDANGDRAVTFADITSVLASFGGAGPQGDANGDGAVNFVDITTVLASYGQPCP